MKPLLTAAAILLGAGQSSPPAPSDFCVPPPARTTPHSPYERAGPWQPDQRTIA